MIEWIKLWVEQIIIAVIIAIIVEMILPNGNKKYIKMVLGLYILFTIISPVISRAGNLDTLLDFDYKKYFDKGIYKETSEEFEDTNNKLIEIAYIDKVKNDVISKIEKLGYKVDNINISIIGNTKSEKYGEISNLEIYISKGNKEEVENKIEIENINIGNNEKTKEESNITENEKKIIKNYVEKEYSLENTNIVKIY